MGGWNVHGWVVSVVLSCDLLSLISEMSDSQLPRIKDNNPLQIINRRLEHIQP